jgi:predicted dehydrogenase/threonine dehydrogenase-like Zn-dependent dehydrogenase
MKQVLQHLNDGSTEVANVPSPRAGPGQLLIRTTRTLVSSGTERMLVDFGKASLLEKARQQPDKVRMVIDKIRTDGLMPTLQAVRSKLDQPMPMGYCHVGVVVELGPGAKGFEVGDRVASNGRHAQWVAVPTNLCAKVPDNVEDDDAVFTVLGAIALQGIRLVQPMLGEAVVVTGLGLIGLLTVQLLRAQGCRVLGLDFDAARIGLARQMGAETVDLHGGADPVAAAAAFSRGRGVDAVIVTASTKSSEPMHQAAQMCRKRGRIVLVGVTGLELSRADFYEKELTFQVSCSYGPGRYDPEYEEKGRDYPVGYVRWTEQRNFEAVLDMLAERRLDVTRLVSHRFDIADAARAYALVAGGEPSLGIVLRYPADEHPSLPARMVPLTKAPTPIARPSEQATTVSVIGAGSYAGAVLIPAFKTAGAMLSRIASTGGTSSLHLGRRFGFAEATTDVEAVLADPQANAVVVCTRHDSHADYVVRALQAGKHVFVEKPLALRPDELNRIEAAMAAVPDKVVMVGFNRRFAPHTERIRSLLTSVPGPKVFVMTVNAGAIPAQHWAHDPQTGGGRLVGEGCHFVDLLRHLADAPILSFQVARMQARVPDTVSVTLQFGDGSLGTLLYLANGSRAFPKERLEIFAAGRVLQLDNFRQLTGFGWPGFRSMKLWRQDKGQTACAAAFLRAIRSGDTWPIGPAQLLEVAQVSIGIEEALH